MMPCAELVEFLSEQQNQEIERDALFKRPVEPDIELSAKYIINKSPLSAHILPNELLSLIFKHASQSGKGVEINISHICRLWRSIAISLTALWSNFTYCHRRDEVSLLSTYLKRSSNQPLNLCFDIQYGGMSSTVKVLMDRAVESVSRWRRFSLKVWNNDSWPHGDLFLPLVQIYAPHLETFEVYTEQDWEPDNETSLDPFRYTFQGGAPLLACVRLDSNSVMGCMPLSNITTLEVELPHWSHDLTPFETFLHFFSFPSANLSLIGTSFDSPRPGFHQVITNTLKTFRCGDLYVTRSLGISLKAPNLEILIIRDYFSNFVGLNWFHAQTPSNDSSPAIFPSLHTLSLVNCDVRFSDLLPLAQATKHVTHLFISHPSDCALEFEFEVFRCMTENRQQTILWPQLDTLTFLVGAETEDDVEGVDFQANLEVVECRSRILNKHCVLELHPLDALWWQTLHPASWDTLVDGGYYRELLPRCTDVVRYLPWPPTIFEDFHGQSPDPFLGF